MCFCKRWWHPASLWKRGNLNISFSKLLKLVLKLYSFDSPFSAGYCLQGNFLNEWSTKAFTTFLTQVQPLAIWLLPLIMLLKSLSQRIPSGCPIILAIDLFFSLPFPLDIPSSMDLFAHFLPSLLLFLCWNYFFWQAFLDDSLPWV